MSDGPALQARDTLAEAQKSARTYAGRFPLREKPGAVVAYGDHRAADPRFREEVFGHLDVGARIADVGAGAHPVIRVPMVSKLGLDYHLLDISQDELDRSAADYNKHALDCLEHDAVIRLVREVGQFDLVLSCWAAEHMRSGRTFHRHVFEMLKPGGTAIHLMPTLYALPFLANRILTDQQAGRILRRASPARKVKFPAYYSWCRGPARRQLQRFESVGFRVERYVGFFGHSFFKPFWPAHAAERALACALLWRPLPLATSFALVVVQRPLDSEP